MKKVLLAIDSFKGCLSSLEAALAVEAGIKAVYPSCEVVKVPVADGGEGTVEALVWMTGGRLCTVEVNDPLMRPISASYGILGDGCTAVIEMSAASGLPLVAPEQRNPMISTTVGTGQLIADALNRGCKQFILGLGGSATNDAGTGLLQALGYRFLDANGKLLGQGGQILEHIAVIDSSSRNPLLNGTQFNMACDVDNPFSGKNGAACIFAPQKGADPYMVEALDRGLKHFAEVVKTQLCKDIDAVAGAGAAGGMGGGLMAFLDAQLRPGIQLVLDTLCFDDLLQGVDLVITGEGRMDAQTAMGKTPSGVAEAAQRSGVPVIALTGNIEDASAINRIGICGVFPIIPRPMSLMEAMNPETAARNIQQAAEQLFRWHRAILSQ
ncbi:MAG: glycerate kinase [Dysgonamonadaceae bacterium]|jgi:glycerate kinase|nr:glycerate kinase [Dysgonamonadaceae bacterium]